MKVLWYCNVLLPKAAEAAKIKGEINTAGWIEGFLNQIWSDYKWGGGYWASSDMRMYPD